MPPDAPSKTYALRRVAALVMIAAGERMRRAPARGPGDVPRSPAEISAEWLTAALCATAPGAVVREVRTVRSSRGTTTRSALELVYNQAGAAAGLPTRVFVKCTSTVAQRLMLGLGGLIEGEAGFYTRVRPGLEIEAPVGYYGAVDPRSWRSVVIAEDVAATRGARFWEPGLALTRAQIEDLLGGVAQLHGALWDDPRLAEWRWLKTPAEQMRLIDALIGLADRTGAGTRRAGAVIPPALRGRAGDLFEGMRRSMVLLSRGPRTYLHGDLHIANTYLTQEDRMGIADWQVGLQGGWAYDVAYLLATALEVADRRAWERDLLELYRDRLAAASGHEVGREEAWLAYRQATFYPYFAWVYTLGRARLQPRFQPDAVSLMMIERIASAIDDLDSLGAVGLR